MPAKLITKPRAAHGWPNLANDMTHIGDWFDEHLLAKKTAPAGDAK